MTLQSSGPISLGDVLAELQRANPSRSEPIRLGDSDVLALAGRPGPACSLSDLYSKSAAPLQVSAPNVLRKQSASGTATVVGTSTGTATGGTGTIQSWAWAWLSGTQFTLSGQNSATCSFSYVCSNGDDFIGTYRLTVVDSAGTTATTSVTVELQGYGQLL